ncbi:energy transducer TonB [Nitrospina sp. 32_T5]|uniref:energy transducer TonB n=1 Tax=unclassified Nitrospina TaxID=2638683 RepID=UPI003F972A1D
MNAEVLETRYPAHLPVTASVVVHLLLAWMIWQQDITFKLEPKPEPKVKVHVAPKPPPPPPPPAQTQPDAVKPVAQKAVTPPQKTVPKKPVTPPTPQPMKAVQTQQVKAKVPPPPASMQPIQQEVATHKPQTPTFARAVRHTPIEATFKTPVSTVPVQSRMTPTTAVLKTPVRTDIPPKAQTVKAQAPVKVDEMIEDAAEPIQTASLNMPALQKTGPVEKVKFSGNGPDLKKALDEFNSAIWGQILQAKYYPKMARIRRLEGQPVVKFTIEKDGSLSHIAINNSSNHEILDSAALKTIRNAAPFPTIPEILNEERMVLEIPISFILNQ